MPRTASRVDANQPAPPTGAGYGVIEYTDEPGRVRFVAWGYLPEAAIAELCAVARKHGAVAHHTDHFIKKSEPH